MAALERNNRVSIEQELAMEAKLEHLFINNLISSKTKALLTLLTNRCSFLRDPQTG